MHIFTAQYYHRRRELLLSALPMISARLLIAATHTSDQETADNQAWSLLPARASVLHALATRCDAQQPHSHTCVCPLKRVGGKRACTLVAGTQEPYGLQRAQLQDQEASVLSQINVICTPTSYVFADPSKLGPLQCFSQVLRLM